MIFLVQKFHEAGRVASVVDSPYESELVSIC